MQERLHPEKVPRIDVEEAHRLVEKGEPVVFVDVRGRPEYEDRHILNAVSMPMAELLKRYGELPRDALIVPY